MPTLPPVAGTQNAVVHTASGGPSVSDIGLSAVPFFGGGVITNAQTTFPFTQDTYLDRFMQPVADACYGFGMEITFDWEAHSKSQGMGLNPADGATFNTYRPAILLTSTAALSLDEHDTRGFSAISIGTKWITSDLSGTFERQKLRKDKVKLAYRRYEAA
jgi:hypothetical protein